MVSVGSSISHAARHGANGLQCWSPQAGEDETLAGCGARGSPSSTVSDAIASPADQTSRHTGHNPNARGRTEPSVSLMPSSSGVKSVDSD